MAAFGYSTSRSPFPDPERGHAKRYIQAQDPKRHVLASEGDSSQCEAARRSRRELIGIVFFFVFVFSLHLGSSFLDTRNLTVPPKPNPNQHAGEKGDYTTEHKRTNPVGAPENTLPAPKEKLGYRGLGRKTRHPTAAAPSGHPDTTSSVACWLASPDTVLRHTGSLDKKVPPKHPPNPLTSRPNPSHLRLRALLSSLLLLHLQQQRAVDVRQDAAKRDGRADQRVQLLIAANSQLQMSGRDALDLEILGGVAREFEDLGGEVFEDRRQVDGRFGADARPVAGDVAEVAFYATAGELWGQRSAVALRTRYARLRPAASTGAFRRAHARGWRPRITVDGRAEQQHDDVTGE